VASNRRAFSHPYATTVGVKLPVVDLRRGTSWYRALFDRKLVAEDVEVVVLGVLVLAPAAVVVLLVEQRLHGERCRSPSSSGW
jgi:hypothetical protein